MNNKIFNTDNDRNGNEFANECCDSLPNVARPERSEGQHEGLPSASLPVPLHRQVQPISIKRFHAIAHSRIKINKTHEFLGYPYEVRVGNCIWNIFENVKKARKYKMFVVREMRRRYSALEKFN